ncbi:hypothetical protein TIFTF001_018527 [Ficus carica]|uniref:Uncharacterized protein n=1 Tax=Ficus carica TaxID=3494 RepID=A0AA88DJ86_FICCA|nr:hypothetical protein TIFTF001_018527 [Ficus carica]
MGKKLFPFPLCSVSEAGKEGTAAVRCNASCGRRRRHLAPQEVAAVGPLSSISPSSETGGPRGRPLPTSEQRPSLPTPSSPSTSRPPLCPSQSLWTRPAFPSSPTIQICRIWLFSSCNNLRRLSRPAGGFHEPPPPCSPLGLPSQSKIRSPPCPSPSFLSRLDSGWLARPASSRFGGEWLASCYRRERTPSRRR